jgi:hypothetical protein
MPRKKLNEITRSEWVAWVWLDATELGDKEKMYIRGDQRDPSESLKTGQEWDAWNEAYNANPVTK